MLRISCQHLSKNPGFTFEWSQIFSFFCNKDIDATFFRMHTKL
uniref:Uncharacterized protein n=1 Tax=Arundo donax TaxID=35708 RepID=A0A0A8Z735_ARUDO